MKSMDELGVPIPSKKPLVVRNIKNVSKEQEDIGIKLREKQILTFGNDSYGKLSGRNISRRYLDHNIRGTL